MAHTAHEPSPVRKQHPVSAMFHSLAQQAQPVAAFWTKFSNDWSWNNAAGLAFKSVFGSAEQRWRGIRCRA